MNNLLFIPVGGLANRMRAVASAVTLMRRVQGAVSAIWFQDWALNAPFNALFQPLEVDGVTMREATFCDRIVYDRPRKKNLYLPRLFQKLLFTHALYEKSITPLRLQHFDFEKWAAQGNCYLASYTNFLPYDYDLLRQLFVPQPEIMAMIEQNIQQFSKRTIGLHIRRTDNIASIQQSPLELFLQAVEKELTYDPNTTLFLATDSEEVKAEFLKRYGNQVITAKEKSDRDSIAGIKGGIIDMYTLAKTQKIYGSFQSSFSELAAQLGDIPLEILQVKP